MKELTNLQQNSEKLSQTHNLKTYVLLAKERTDPDLFTFDKLVLDVQSEFPHLKDEDFKKALKNGGLGKYGKTYRITIQEVLLWIRAYEKESKRALEPHEALRLGVHTNF